MIQTTDYQCFVEVYEWVLKCNINNSWYGTDYRLLFYCFVEVYESQWACMHLLVCVCMYSHYVRERCTAACSITSEQRRHDSKQHVIMPPARAQEHKRRKAHTYQNTTHGAASRTIPGIWYPLSIVHYLASFFFCWCPMRHGNICWLPTSQSPHMKRDKQTRYSKDTRTLQRSAW